MSYDYKLDDDAYFLDTEYLLSHEDIPGFLKSPNDEEFKEICELNFENTPQEDQQQLQPHEDIIHFKKKEPSISRPIEKEKEYREPGHYKSYEPYEKRERRNSCHRCGNVRKTNIECSECPQIFCVKCAEKLVFEHGSCTFLNGCPVCNNLCCCRAKSVNCTNQFHCYKKCPAYKNSKAVEIPVSFFTPVSTPLPTPVTRETKRRASNASEYSSFSMDVDDSSGNFIEHEPKFYPNVPFPLINATEKDYEKKVEPKKETQNIYINNTATTYLNDFFSAPPVLPSLLAPPSNLHETTPIVKVIPIHVDSPKMAKSLSISRENIMEDLYAITQRKQDSYDSRESIENNGLLKQTNLVENTTFIPSPWGYEPVLDPIEKLTSNIDRSLSPPGNNIGIYNDHSYFQGDPYKRDSLSDSQEVMGNDSPVLFNEYFQRDGPYFCHDAMKESPLNRDNCRCNGCLMVKFPGLFGLYYNREVDSKILTLPSERHTQNVDYSNQVNAKYRNDSKKREFPVSSQQLPARKRSFTTEASSVAAMVNGILDLNPDNSYRESSSSNYKTPMNIIEIDDFLKEM